MASAQDFLDSINAVRDKTEEVKGKLDTVNNHLTSIEGKLDTIDASVKAVDASIKQMQQVLLWGFNQLVALGHYTNQALYHNNQQNDAMICILQQISVNTCGIWNETHTQTGLQQGINGAIRKLADLYAATHGDAALTLEREEQLRRQIEACCPPEPPASACDERPCPAPPPFEERPPRPQPPPQVERPPIG